MIYRSKLKSNHHAKSIGCYSRKTIPAKQEIIKPITARPPSSSGEPGDVQISIEGRGESWESIDRLRESEREHQEIDA